jgi:hypothetical protein
MHGEAGHTILETLIALTILLFGLIPIANLFLVAATATSAAHHQTAAVTQASEVMEMLKAIPFPNLLPGGDLDRDVPHLNSSAPPLIEDANHDLSTYNLYRSVAGVGTIRTRWRIRVLDRHTRYVEVLSESTAALARGRSRVALATLRTCAAEAPPVACP